MSLNLATIMMDVRVLIGDYVNFQPEEAGQVSGVTFTDQTIIDSINFAIKQYCKLKKATYTEATVPIKSYFTEMTGAIQVPSDFIEIVRVIYNGQVLNPSTYSFEALKNPFFTSNINSTESPYIPLRWFMADNITLVLTPFLLTWIPNSAVIGYIQMPISLVNGTDIVDPRILTQDQEYLKYAASSFLMLIQEDSESVQKAEVYDKLFKKFIGV